MDKGKNKDLPERHLQVLKVFVPYQQDLFWKCEREKRYVIGSPRVAAVHNAKNSTGFSDPTNANKSTGSPIQRMQARVQGFPIQRMQTRVPGSPIQRRITNRNSLRPGQ